MRYVSVEHQKAIAPRYRQAALIIGGFIASVLLYMAIARLITPGDGQPGSEKWQQPIYSAVLVLGLVVVVLRRLLMSQSVMNRAAAGGADNVLRKLLTATIVIAAAAEVIAILGLIFYLLTADYQYSWRLGVISLLLLAYAFPRRGEWERILTASAEARKK
ncbi:MAG: hypothetical protein ACREEM_19665 [Blastocatellia bacterium]